MKLTRKIKLLIGLVVLTAFGSSVNTSCKPTRTCYKTMPVDYYDSTSQKQAPVHNPDLAIDEDKKNTK